MAKKRSHDHHETNSADAVRQSGERSRAAAPVDPALRTRPVIEGVRPRVEGGMFPAKTSQGDLVTIAADAFLDGHDLLHCEVRYLAPGQRDWMMVPMVPIGDDRWQATFPADEIGPYQFVVSASVDRFATWRQDLSAKMSAGQNVAVDLEVGSSLVLEASKSVRGADRRFLENVAGRLTAFATTGEMDAGVGYPPPDEPADPHRVVMQLVGDPRLAAAVRSTAPRENAATSAPLTVVSEPASARFASWYELFPRSASRDEGRHGTLNDVTARLPYLEGLQIDVLYLPPIHPIGRANRKGRDGVPSASPTDPGSPWAIGSEAGGHDTVHPELGTLGDFDALVQAASKRGIQIALDLAFQCSPDHPWVHQHPSWFRHLPDGSIQFAENPPKRYEDIYPIDFDTPDWEALWLSLAEVVRFWIGHGISIFRVDNPHTKPLGFWQWLIAAIKEDHPEVVFLSEAFTRPRVMERLAKVGFSQSYTYFTWRTSKYEIEQYLNQLVHTDVADYFRPNLWPNTPDILPEQLQRGATSTFVSRLILAATLAASYGIYGPAFELQEHRATKPGSEEYADSEKYMVRHWDLDRSDSLGDLVTRVNSIRRLHPALQRNETLKFHSVDNDQLMAYSKSHPPSATDGALARRSDGSSERDVVLVVVNLDPVYTQGGWVFLDLETLGLDPERSFEVHDLLTDARYRWQGARNFVQLDPGAAPAHIFAVRQPEGRLTPAVGQ
jgi:starch synthase (maltosyl-transferring)